MKKSDIHPALESIGEMAVFYLPEQKLREANQWAKDKKNFRQQIHNYLMEHHGAYTTSDGGIEGFWRARSIHSPIFKEKNVRYEVSFDGGEDAVKDFVEFLSIVCCEMNEQVIYLTMGKKSYLVHPKFSIPDQGESVEV